MWYDDEFGQCNCSRCSNTNSNVGGSSKKSERPSRPCQSCICKQLQKLTMGVEVDVTTTSLAADDFVTLTFKQFDCHTCCVTFTQEGYSDVIIDCHKIRAIRFP